MFYQVVVKSVTEHGWFLNVPLLGAPHSLDLRDVPTSDNNLHILILRLLSLGSSHYPTVLNAFYLLGFVLVFLSAFGVFRYLGVAWWTGVSAALLFAFAPFHIQRGEHHLFLSAYWQVPLAVLMALSTSGVRLDASGSGPTPAWHAGRWARIAAGVGICLVLSATGFYYAFFASYLLVVAGFVAFSRDGRWQHMALAVGLVAVIASGLLLGLAPSLVRFQQAGSVPAVQREAGDADTYGLRMAQLLLPVRGHVLEPLAAVRADYGRRPAVNENDDVSLGIVGALGFLSLLWWFMFRKPAIKGPVRSGAHGLMDHLSVFTLAAVLLATIGGLGSLVAFFGLPYVRAYNRIGVFLSFAALLAVAIGVDHAARRIATTRWRAWAFHLAVGVATVLALFDQVSPSALPAYNTTRAQFASDSAFVRAIEAQVPQGAMIFQLPFVPFPEAPQSQVMRDYDLLRGYLHSSHLRWSYGTVRGREPNSWLRRTSALPVAQLLDTLAWGGFSGVYIDRHGFADGADHLQHELDAALDATPLYSSDRELVFYNLAEHRARLERDTPRDAWAGRREAALHPPLAVWREGFYPEEGDAGVAWRWARSRATLALINSTSHPQQVRLRMLLTPNVGGTALVQSPLLRAPIRVERHQPLIDEQILLPPGRHDVHFESDAPTLSPPNDFRELVFEVRDLELSPLRTAVVPPL